MTTSRVLVFIPTYNEAGNVCEMVDRLRALDLGLDILFIDDASPDGTGLIIDRLAVEDPSVVEMHRSCRKGVGSAHAEGIAVAYDKGYAVLITMDGDFTHPPGAVPALVKAAEDGDVVVGSRFAADDGFDGWSRWRKMLSLAGHWATGRLLGLSCDATGAFRAYRLDRIPRSLFERVRSPGYAFFFESLFVLAQNDVAIQEIPVRTERRRYGRSKMGFCDMTASLATVIRLSGKARWPRWPFQSAAAGCERADDDR